MPFWDFEKYFIFPRPKKQNGGVVWYQWKAWHQWTGWLLRYRTLSQIFDINQQNVKYKGISENNGAKCQKFLYLQPVMEFLTAHLFSFIALQSTKCQTISFIAVCRNLKEQTILIWFYGWKIWLFSNDSGRFVLSIPSTNIFKGN